AAAKSPMSWARAGRLNWHDGRDDGAGRRAGAGRARPGRRRAGVPRARRAVSAGPGDPLLPDARLAPRRRGPRPGDAAARVAVAGPVRAPGVAVDLAVPDRDQRLPGRDRAPAAAGR